MKVLIVLPYLAAIGGATRFSIQLSEYLVTKGNKILIASLYSKKELFKPKKNIDFIDIADKNSLTQSIRFWINLKKIRKKLVSVIDSEKPDVVLFINFPATLFADRHNKIPILCYPQDIQLLYSDTYTKNLSKTKYLTWKFFRLFVRIYEKQKWKNFDQVIASSKFTSKHILEKYGITSTVIYPGTDTQIFSPPASYSKKRVILSIGDIKPRNAHFLLETAYILSKSRNDFKIWIVGNKDDYDLEMKKYVEKRNLTTIVKFFGRVSDSELSRLYAESLVVVHLVKQAPFGLIATEAMACGTPVIAWKPSGVEESIIHNQTGFLIEENNHQELIKYIKKLLDNPELSITMGNKARLRVQQFFEQHEKYDEILSLMEFWASKFKQKNDT